MVENPMCRVAVRSRLGQQRCRYAIAHYRAASCQSKIRFFSATANPARTPKTFVRRISRTLRNWKLEPRRHGEERLIRKPGIQERQEIGAIDHKTYSLGFLLNFCLLRVSASPRFNPMPKFSKSDLAAYL